MTCGCQKEFSNTIAEQLQPLYDEWEGKVIGSDEKTEILQWMRSRPLKQCTALVCGFANWADTAPLPCFLLKK